MAAVRPPRELTFATPALAVTRNGARLDLGATRARLTASYAPGRHDRFGVEELKLGEILSAATGTSQGAARRRRRHARRRARSRRCGARARRRARDRERRRAGARGLVDRQGRHRGGCEGQRRGATAWKASPTLSAYDVSMGVEGASIDVPVPVMTLTGASGKVQIARGVLTARNVAGDVRRLEPSRRRDRAGARARRSRLRRFRWRSTSTWPRAIGACCACCAIPRSPRRSTASSRSPDAPRARSRSAGGRQASPNLRRDEPQREAAVRRACRCRSRSTAAACTTRPGARSCCARSQARSVRRASSNSTRRSRSRPGPVVRAALGHGDARPGRALSVADLASGRSRRSAARSARCRDRSE